MPQAVIVPVAPVFPDFHLCDRVYGSQMFLTDCLRTAANLPAGSQIVSYYNREFHGRLRYQSNPYTLPYMVNAGQFPQVERISDLLNSCLIRRLLDHG